MRTVDPDKINAALELDRLNLPARPRVRRIIWRDYRDWSGEEALRIWALLDDRTPKRDRAWERIEPIHRVIHETLEQIGEERFPYITFWTEAEWKEHRGAR